MTVLLRVCVQRVRVLAVCVQCVYCPTCVSHLLRMQRCVCAPNQCVLQVCCVHCCVCVCVLLCAVHCCAVCVCSASVCALCVCAVCVYVLCVCCVCVCARAVCVCSVTPSMKISCHVRSRVEQPVCVSGIGTSGVSVWDNPVCIAEACLMPSVMCVLLCVCVQWEVSSCESPGRVSIAA